MDPAGLDNRNAMVDFPSSGGPTHPGDSNIPLPQHLPFRRISFPSSTRNIPIRPQSIVSTTSLDSTDTSHLPSSPGKGVGRGPRHRQTSVEALKRNNRRREVMSIVTDEQRDARRRKVINEFYETERTYVEGLELIYSHFLTPIIASLDTPNQLLDRTELTSVFSNFIDIWNLHRSFYSSLSALMAASSSTSLNDESPPLSPTLLSHFPYLSLYTPFVCSFTDALASYAALLAKHSAFAAFMATKEADPRCGNLRFRDWLLTIVQRCPRYLLLLKDLINNTNPEDPEYAPLLSVHKLVSRITDSLNASLHVHAQMLELVAIQRSTSNLPFQLITPGRVFVKRGPLLQVVGSTPKEQEFLLFSDCIIWISGADKDDTDASSRWDLFSGEPRLSSALSRPKTLVRSRSKSDADLPRISETKRRDSGLRLRPAGQKKNIKRLSSGGGEDRWVFRGHIDLVDVDVVLGSAAEAGEERRFELLSPQHSFALYAHSVEERDEWSSAIRSAKESLLLSLNVMNPNSTLTSSTSTNHLRHALQALPYLPDDQEGNPKRGRVEHFVPAVWIPDGKTESCMRCGRTFGWSRRRHHCRLCGRCICAQCSTKTFFIVDSTDASSKYSHKSARACDACYDTVFPVMEHPSTPAAQPETISRLTLSGLRSMPSLLLQDQMHVSPSVFMSIDFESPRRPQTSDSGLFSRSPPREASDGSHSVHVAALRIKAASRPRSSVHILEDFNSGQGHDQSLAGSPNTSRFSDRLECASFVLNDLPESEEDTVGHPSPTLAPSKDLNPGVSSPLGPSRKEDTVRRRKRFSMPALAIHTTPVTTRTNAVGEGKARRWSLVLGNLRGGGADSSEGSKPGVVVGKLSELLRRQSQNA